MIKQIKKRMLDYCPETDSMPEQEEGCDRCGSGPIDSIYEVYEHEDEWLCAACLSDALKEKQNDVA